TGQAIVYTFKISTAGQYTVKAMGLGHQFRGRLEDTDGWPIVAPNGPADYTRRFETGSYRLGGLPEPSPSRSGPLPPRRHAALRFRGHGPHKLLLARRVEHLWMEPASGQQRVPDAWLFELPAPGQISIELTDEMNGDLFRIAAGGSTERIAHVPPLSGWKGPL